VAQESKSLAAFRHTSLQIHGIQKVALKKTACQNLVHSLLQISKKKTRPKDQEIAERIRIFLYSRNEVGEESYSDNMGKDQNCSVARTAQRA
jgi:hypothetical protein